MEYAARRRLKRDLAFIRQTAATFLDRLSAEDIHEPACCEQSIATWANIGNADSLAGDLNIRSGALEEAAESWLCALTAFEVAKLGAIDLQQG
jgi:hypothetical protein